MYDSQYLRHRVVWGGGQPSFVYRFNNFQIIDVVADVSHLVNFGSGLITYATQVTDFVVYALKQISKLELGSSGLEA